MDSDIKYILEEENKLAQMVEDSKKAARERVEEHRSRMAEFRESELNRIAAEYSNMSEMKLQEIKSRMDNDLRKMRLEQERLLDDTELRNKITGRIVSVILENRT